MPPQGTGTFKLSRSPENANTAGNADAMDAKWFGHQDVAAPSAFTYALKYPLKTDGSGQFSCINDENKMWKFIWDGSVGRSLREGKPYPLEFLRDDSEESYYYCFSESNHFLSESNEEVRDVEWCLEKQSLSSLQEASGELLSLLATTLVQNGQWWGLRRRANREGGTRGNGVVV